MHKNYSRIDGPVLEIDIGQRLAVCVPRDKARGHFLHRPGRREARRAHVRFGSKADIEARQSDVCFTPESGHGR
jgi:hypothetical protein